jgi:hypothetical protein
MDRVTEEEILRTIVNLKNRLPNEMGTLITYLKQKLDDNIVKTIQTRDYGDIRFAQGCVVALSDILKSLTDTTNLLKRQKQSKERSHIGGI